MSDNRTAFYMSLAFELRWGKPNSMKRSMAAANFVAGAFDKGQLKPDEGYGWPVEAEAALIRAPLKIVAECIALTHAGLGDMVPSQVSMVEDVRADLAKRGL
jgi:hypothetical protein